jgi:hypothetical protein
MTMLFMFAIFFGFIVVVIIIVIIIVIITYSFYCRRTTGYNIQVQQTTDNVIIDNV